MDLLVLIMELLGIVVYASSAAMTALKKGFDLFGVIMLGLITSVGGGLIRDLVLGNTPPVIFRVPIYAIVAMVTALITFLPFIANYLRRDHKHVERIQFLLDSLGLAVFTVVGVRTAFETQADPSMSLLIFVGVITGVGGGILRDILVGNPPVIFVKYFYAMASLIGASIYAVLGKYANQPTLGFILGAIVIVILRFLAMHYHWKFPKYPPQNEEDSK